MQPRLFVFWLMVLLGCSSAIAQDASHEDVARARFFDGKAAYERGEYGRAYVNARGP
jgi:hypothetical protein